MQASPRKPQKRIGGAAFSGGQRHLRSSGKAWPLKEAVDPSSPGRGNGQQVRHPAATVSGIAASARGRRESPEAAGQRCHSDDARSYVSTPCTERAQQYVSRLAGQGVPAAAAATISAPLEWALVQEMDVVDSISKENERRKQERQKRMEHQNILRQQQESQMKVKDECRHLWRQWRDELEDDAQRFKKEEDEKRARQIEVRRRFDEDRRRQLEAVHKDQRARREADQKEGRAMVVAAEEAKRKADELEESRRQKERAQASKMAEEAKKAKNLKEKRKVEEHENDIKMARAQQEVLDKQDRDRAAFFQRMKDKQSGILAAYAAGVGNDLERRQKEDEERAQRQQQQVIEKERLQVEAKEQRLREMKEAGRLAVAQQLEAQERLRKQAQEEELAFVARLRQQTLLQDQAEMEKQKQKRQAVEANAAYIRQQIMERDAKEPRQVQRDRMNEVERQLNRDKLERAKDAERPDGLQLLLKKKKMEYRSAHSAR